MIKSLSSIVHKNLTGFANVKNGDVTCVKKHDNISYVERTENGHPNNSRNN